ncbi:MAG: G-protein coupled receptor, partial [Gammaproteobacteria bacterium]|nr:G-protein coupled receptor [Gammaproteobacteria bacterium]
MSNDSSATDSVYPLGSVVCCALMLVATTIGVFGNILTFYIFSRRTMRSSINILLAGLALIDIGVLVFGTAIFVPFGTWAYFYDTNPALYEFMGAYLTVFFQPLPLIAQTASIWALILITIERFLAVCYPFLAKRF